MIDTEKSKALKIPQLKPEDNLKGFPDKFDYDFYYKLSTETSLKKWSWQFQQRVSKKVSYLNSFLIISDNNKTIEETKSPLVLEMRNDLEVDWQNGVYTHATVKTITEYNTNNYSPLDPADYIDNRINKLIHLSNGKHISSKEYESNQKLREEFPIQIKSYNMKIRLNHEKNGLTIFNNSSDKNKFLDSIKKYENTKAFLVNLQMPTSKIIEELKKQIEALKKENDIVEINIPFNNIIQTWAIGLACWDLKHQWNMKNVEIHGRYLHFLKEGFQEDRISDDEYKGLFKDKYNSVKKMISGGWKKLSGEPI